MSQSRKVIVVWFRQDLRVCDNPALDAAAKLGSVLPIYILDDESAGEHKMGAASRVWLHHSLTSLNASFDGKLAVFRGSADAILRDLTKQFSVHSIFWNRCYEPWSVARDKGIMQDLKAAGHVVKSFNGSLLWEPWEACKADGTPYRVFTPFYKNAQRIAPRAVLSKAEPDLVDITSDTNTIESLDLLPKLPWDKPLLDGWQIGEAGAEAALDAFLQNGLANYKAGRDFPALLSVSRLSPHLHFGEISPHTVRHMALARGDNANIEHFCRELGWREFSYNLLYHFPDLPRKNLQTKFDHFPWQDDPDMLLRWQKGMTGYPIIDAGMRELWQTGYMHNRVRMIVGSFLVKNLLLHWHHGERWFWDCLFDADLANNSASWQWVAGCGADAAPYFRIFNPITQGEKFDASGEYTRHFVPEIAALPDKYLHCPWMAPSSVLEQAGIALGDTYPLPIVDLKSSRTRALEAYDVIKAQD